MNSETIDLLNKRIGQWLTALRVVAPTVVTLEKAAAVIGIDSSKLLEIESGQESIACEDLAPLADFYGASDAAIEDLMLGVTEGHCISEQPKPAL